MSRSASCRRRCRSCPSPTSITGRRRGASSRPDGPIRPRITASGASWSTSGSSHCKSRYGQGEVEQWYWEVWNEPNIFYWRGTPEDYHRLYDHAADAVKRALPAARVGGPEVAGTRTPDAAKFLRDFLEHCLRGTNHATGKIGAPLDFIAFHAKGSPRIAQGHVQMGIATQLQDIDRGFEVVAGFPELKDRPIVIGESDPDGCAACPATVFPQNGYRNGALYASYTAAAYARTLDLALKHSVNLEGSLTWAFEFEDQPYFAGFRVLASNGVDLPVLNVFRMLGLLGGRRLPVESTADRGVEELRLHGVRQAPEVMALAGLEDRSLSVLVWHYHDDDLPAEQCRRRAEHSRPADRRRSRAGAASPDRRRPQQRLHRVAANGLSPAADARSNCRAQASRSPGSNRVSPVAATANGRSLTPRSPCPVKPSP